MTSLAGAPATQVCGARADMPACRTALTPLYQCHEAQHRCSDWVVSADTHTQRICAPEQRVCHQHTCLLPAEERAHVDQILAIVVDAVAEGRLAFHPKDFYKTHKMQVEESKPYVVQYGNERLPKYMQVRRQYCGLGLPTEVWCVCHADHFVWCRQEA